MAGMEMRESMYNILICDDEKDIVNALKIYLNDTNYHFLEAFDGEEAVHMVETNEVHLVLMDIMMPKLDGIQAMIRIREKSNVPVILLTAKGEDSDKVLGLTVGADDYITKPFGVMELISRVKALLRRTQSAAEETKICHGEIRMDNDKHAVFVGNEPCELTFKEYELLKYLMINAGIVLSRDKIMDQVWGFEYEGESRTVDMHIKTLRQKLGAAGSCIKTIRNVGYMIE